MKLLLIFAFVVLASAKKTFHGDQVLTVYPRNTDQVKLLQLLGNRPGLVDFWSPDSADQIIPNIPVDIRFPQQHLISLKKMLADSRIDYEVKIEDVQVLVDNQIKNRNTPRALGAYDYDVYHTYDQIVDWAKGIAADNPTLASYYSLGTTFQGREIPYLVIETNPTNPSILIDCGMHAREWISPAFCQCFVRNLLSDDDSVLKDLRDQLTFVIIPVLNADGYAFSWADDRMWRKTRSKYGTLCYGVDPNRNFDADWGGLGASSNPCSETYYGPSLASEPITQHLSKLVRDHKDEFKAYLTFHSYSQVIIFPYAYKYDKTPDNDDLQSYGDKAAAAIKGVNGKSFDVGMTATLLYPASGGSDDFAYDQGVRLTYTVELRDKGKYGFLLPEDQIAPTCVETTEAVKVFAQAVITELAAQ